MAVAVAVLVVVAVVLAVWSRLPLELSQWELTQLQLVVVVMVAPELILVQLEGLALLDLFQVQMAVPMVVVKEIPEAPEDLVVVDQMVPVVVKELLAKEMTVVILSLIEVAVAVAVRAVPETKAPQHMLVETVVLLETVVTVEAQ